MSRRLIDTTHSISEGVLRTAMTYRDADWNEFQVELRIDGIKQVECTYFTDDREDARHTAQAMVRMPSLVPATSTQEG